MTEKLPTLKPCPFCGAKPKIRTDGTKKFWFISCNSMDCEICPEADDFESFEKAQKAWNTRAPITTHQKRVKSGEAQSLKF